MGSLTNFKLIPGGHSHGRGGWALPRPWSWPIQPSLGAIRQVIMLMVMMMAMIVIVVMVILKSSHICWITRCLHSHISCYHNKVIPFKVGKPWFEVGARGELFQHLQTYLGGAVCVHCMI